MASAIRIFWDEYPKIYKENMRILNKRLKVYDESLKRIENGCDDYPRPRQYERPILKEMYLTICPQHIRDMVSMRERYRQTMKIYKLMKKGVYERLLPVEEAKMVPIENIHDFGTKRNTSRGFSCRCPFDNHNDSNPSFYVYYDTNSYHCFGCQKSGDTISFIQNLLGLDFKQAVKYIIKDEKMDDDMIPEEGTGCAGNRI